MSVKCKYNWRGTGWQVWYDSNTLETLHIVGPTKVVDDDFCGAYLRKYITAENTTALWSTVETELNTGIGLVADGTNGVAAIILDNDDIAEVGVLHFGDNECLKLEQGLLFECRLTYNVLPTTGTETVQSVFGIAGAHNTTLDTIDVSAWFRVESAAQTALLWEVDDNHTNDDDNATGITLVADTYNIYQIHVVSISEVNFYVDGIKVGTGSMAGLTGAEGKVQPYFNVSKAKSAANTGTGTMYIDYVRVWQDRS